MRARTSLAVLLVLTGLTSWALADDDLLMKQAQALFQPIPLELPAVKGVNATPPMVALGKDLYFDPRLSKSHNISCNTCHQIGLGGDDALSTSIGHNWQRGGRNAPTVLNAVFNVAQFWDGRAEDLKAQAGGPIQNPIEMGITHEHAIEMLKAIPGYAPLFQAAFPDDKDPINMPNVVTAIAAFETTLTTPNSPFDKYLRGDQNALTPEQKAGLQLFISTLGGQYRRSDVCPIRCRREAGCRYPATRRQRAICGYKIGERPVCVPRSAIAQCGADDALFSHRPGVGSDPGRRHHGD
jgi:cytochrome c peroxidase